MNVVFIKKPWRLMVWISICLLAISYVACGNPTEPGSEPGTEKVQADGGNQTSELTPDANESEPEKSEPDNNPPIESAPQENKSEGGVPENNKPETHTPENNNPDVPKVLKIPTKPECDNINLRYCPLPWPSMRYLKPHAKHVTGYRIEYDVKALPKTSKGVELNAEPFKRLDGFSPNTQILTLFAEPVDVKGMAGKTSIPKSLEKDHPTVLMDLKTGEKIPHWVENDARSDDPKQVLFYIRPAVRLQYNRTYGVAIRGMKGKSGVALEPELSFKAMRDNLKTDSDQLEKRRKSFETLFTTLEKNGVQRKDLLAAWQFKTSSFESNHNTMLKMREDAIKRLGAEGIGCTVKKVEKKSNANIIEGTITTPFYMTADKLPAEISRDKDGNPKYVKNVEVTFTALIPKSLLDAPKSSPFVTFGHGLFGQASGTLKNRNMLALANQLKAIAVGVDWAGMSRSDLLFLATALADISKFYMVGEMLRQAMINQIALTRTVLGKCRNLPAFQKDGKTLIDPKRPYYIGVSQGAILGGTYLTLSPDIKRGVLLVGGTHFSFMIERSIHFDKTFLAFFKPAYPARINRGILMAISQHVWDNGESANYLPHATKGIKGGTPKEFMYVIAENDAQVPNLSSDLGARGANIPVLASSFRKPWGVKEVKAPYKGSAYISYNYGDPANPDGNQSPKKDFGGHYNVPVTPSVAATYWRFLETGEIVLNCKGVCDLTKKP